MHGSHSPDSSSIIASLPRDAITSWDEEQTNQLLGALGMSQYQHQLREHGITGEILVHLDHEGLRDVGIGSVGQRLSVLKTVYELKMRDDVPIEEGHWRPPSDEMSQILLDSPAGVIPPHMMQQMLHERDDRIDALEQDVSHLITVVESLQNQLLSLHAERQPRRAPSLRLASETEKLHTPLSPDRLDSSVSGRSQPLSNGMTLPDGGARVALTPGIQSGGSGNGGGSTPLTPTTPTSANPLQHGPQSGTVMLEVSGHNAVEQLSAPAPAPPSRSEPASNNPLKVNYKVTLDDPCYKVLPAALRKYKINDDWRLYALFICYGANVERCLSLDERPLLLFQKLKEQGANPVFMLRHVKDIKSPIAMAAAKHAARRDKKSSFGDDHSSTSSGPGPHPQAMPDPQTTSPVGYCIAIYPYMAERADEFDVACGDVFVILSKYKGWWVVYRDLGSRATEADRAELKSGWIPAGCLLETSVLPLGQGPIDPNERTTAPINPLAIVSISTPGVALMDYDPHGRDELRIRTGDALRIYKRYNSWSYAIREETAERGWAPSWLVGKARSGTSSSTGAGGDDGLRSAKTSRDSPLRSANALGLEERTLPSPRDTSPLHQH